MNDPAPESSIAQLTAKIEDVILGIKWMFALFLIVISIPNVLASLSIHRFAEIFQDALPGKPLPLLTSVVIGHPGFLQLLTLAWPIIGVTNIVRGKKVRNWVIGTALITFFIGLQLVLTQMALFMPMVGTFEGMSDTSAK